MLRTFARLCTVTLAALGACGDEPCPVGTVPIGDVCAPADDGGPIDAAMPDGSPDGTVTCTGYEDRDGDGHGAGPALTGLACPLSDGYAPTDGDCNDGSTAVSPSADETCNDADDDCDARTDEGRLGPIGGPTLVVTGADGINSIAIGAAAESYVVAVAAGVVIYQQLNADAQLVGSQGVVDRSTSTFSQTTPAILITDDGVPPRALITYFGDISYLRGRSVLADGSDSGPLIDITILQEGAVGIGQRLVRAGDRVAVVWSEIRDGVAMHVRLRDLDFVGMSSAPVVDVADVGGSFSPRPSVVSFAAGTLWITVPWMDEAYIWTMEPAPASWTLADGRPQRVIPSMPAEATVLTRTFGGEVALGSGTSSSGSEIAIASKTVFGFAPVSTTSAILDGDGSVMVGMPVDTSGPVVAELLERSGDEWSRTEVEGEGGSVEDVTIAMRDPSHGALLYVTRETGSMSRVYAQALGCR